MCCWTSDLVECVQTLRPLNCMFHFENEKQRMNKQSQHKLSVQRTRSSNFSGVSTVAIGQLYYGNAIRTKNKALCNLRTSKYNHQWSFRCPNNTCSRFFFLHHLLCRFQHLENTIKFIYTREIKKKRNSQWKERIQNVLFIFVWFGDHVYTVRVSKERPLSLFENMNCCHFNGIKIFITIY